MPSLTQLSRLRHNLNERAAGYLANLVIDVIPGVKRELLARTLGSRSDLSQCHGGANANQVIFVVERRDEWLHRVFADTRHRCNDLLHMRIESS